MAVTPAPAYGGYYTPPPKSSNNTWMILGIVAAVVVALVIALGAISAMSGATRNSVIGTGSAQAECERVADQAVRISEDHTSQNGKRILKIRSITVVTDNRSTYSKPVGNTEATVMECTGYASWSDTSAGTVALTETIDSDGTVFVAYKAAP